MDTESVNVRPEESPRAQLTPPFSAATPPYGSFLADASKQLAASLDYDVTMASVVRLAIPTYADSCAVDIVVDDGIVRRLAVAHVDPAKESLASALAQSRPPTPTASTGVMQVLGTGRPAVLPELSTDSLAGPTGDAEDLQALGTLGLSSAIIVPMMARARILGALTFAAAEPRRPHKLTDLTLAVELAERCAEGFHFLSFVFSSLSVNRYCG